jgi:hypothetical protein
MEGVYQRLVQRDLAHLGIRDRFYPVGGAANYALLYILIRLAFEFSFENIVELGAGQSSLLLDALWKAGSLSSTITTIEDSGNWAKTIEDQVSHKIERIELAKQTLAGVKFCGYDFSNHSFKNIDLLLIDGPPASSEQTAFSRLGALNLIEYLNEDGFVIVADDTHREGEIFLLDLLESNFRKRHIDFQKGQIITTKRQTILASGKYKSAVFY